MTRIIYSGKQQLSCDPHVQGGALCLRGTRFSVSTILRFVAGEDHPELVAAYAPALNRHNVRQALEALAEICDSWPEEARSAAELLDDVEDDDGGTP